MLAIYYYKNVDVKYIFLLPWISRCFFSISSNIVSALGKASEALNGAFILVTNVWYSGSKYTLENKEFHLEFI